MRYKDVDIVSLLRPGRAAWEFDGGLGCQSGQVANGRINISSRTSGLLIRESLVDNAHSQKEWGPER